MMMEIRTRVDNGLYKSICEKDGECVVLGAISGYEKTETTIGESYRFRGQFRVQAKDEETGELQTFCEAPAAYYPRLVEDTILRQCEAEEHLSDDGHWEVYSMFRLFLIPDNRENSKTGYRWGAEPLLRDESRTSPLDAIEKRISALKLGAGN
jgi:hypothetical protein